MQVSTGGDIGKWIALKRVEQGMSQQELAAKLYVTAGLISHIEKGRKIPTLAMVIDIADLFGCSIDEIVGRSVS